MTEPIYLTVATSQPITSTDRANNIIHGVAIVTLGTAHGSRGMSAVIDEAFLAAVIDLGNASAGGIRARFGHRSGDRPDTFLGRFRNFRRDGDTVRADLYFSKSAQKAPGGNLAEYVIELAEEDPDMLGASIEYKPDTIDKKGNATGIRELSAVAIVDQPAANPTGLFSAPSGASEKPQHTEGERTMEITEQELSEKLAAEKAAGETAGAAAERARLEAMLSAFPGHPEVALAAYQDGKTPTEAKAAQADHLAEQLADAQAKLAEAQQQMQLARQQATPPADSQPNPAPYGEAGQPHQIDLSAAIDQHMSENPGVSFADASRAVIAKNPELYKA